MGFGRGAIRGRDGQLVDEAQSETIIEYPDDNNGGIGELL